MVLKLIRYFALLIAALALTAAPAPAHKNHHEKAEAVQAQPTAADQVAAPAPGTALTTHTAVMVMHEMDEEDEDRSKMSTFERLLDWLGRLHPVLVHFPIAFLTAGLVTAVVGRRRRAFQKPVQFLVVAGGLLAPVAVVLGWLNGGFSLTDADPLLRVHRWLGTAIGIGGVALALWAIRRPDEDRKLGMIVGLGLITAAIVVQGWFGGAIVHGVDHMNW